MPLQHPTKEELWGIKIPLIRFESSKEIFYPFWGITDSFPYISSSQIQRLLRHVNSRRMKVKSTPRDNNYTPSTLTMPLIIRWFERDSLLVLSPTECQRLLMSIVEGRERPTFGTKPLISLQPPPCDHTLVQLLKSPDIVAFIRINVSTGFNGNKPTGWTFSELLLYSHSTFTFPLAHEWTTPWHNYCGPKEVSK